MSKPIYETSEFTVDLCPECTDTKHPAFLVRDKKNVLLGSIKWYPRLDEYCFFPRDKTAWNWDCLFHLTNFLISQLEIQLLEATRGPAS